MQSSPKRLLPLAIIALAGIAAIVAVQWQHIATRPSPQAILTAAADAQHELTRVPSAADRLSDADEIAIGDQLAAGYASLTTSRTSTAAQQKATEAYLQRIGDRVASHARRHLPWRFHYIPNPGFINAFALPGGHIFVGQGLLALMQSEDALAAVLGHEVEHVDLRHCAERVQTEAHLRNLGLLGSLAGLPVELFIAGYSKEQELEADRDGTTLAVQSNYSPLGILQLFQEFAKLEQRYESTAANPRTPVGEAAQISLATLAGYFRSHPPADVRSSQVRTLIATQHWPTPPLRCLSRFDPAAKDACPDKMG